MVLVEDRVTTENTETETSGARKLILEKLLAVAADIGRLEPTGKTPQGKQAISIADMENAVRDGFIEQGLLTIWSDEHLESYTEPTRSGQMMMWQVRMRVDLYCVERPDIIITAFAEDVGNSPASAKAFARKALYKAWFHVAMADDDLIPASTRAASGGAENARRTQQEQNRQTRQEREGATTTTQERRNEDTPTASPYKPASTNQLATIAKLSRLAGKPEEPSPDMTSAEASERITVLSREYNEIKGQTGRRA